MGGLELPAELVAMIERLGLQWPEAREFAIMTRGGDWLGFGTQAMRHAEASMMAVTVMQASNHSDGLDAFAGYFDKVAGSSGYLFRSTMTDTLSGLALIQAGVLVLEFKIITMVALASLAVVVAAASAVAVETLGTSLVAAAAYAEEIYTAVIVAQRVTQVALQQIGAPLAELIHDLLNVQFERLQDRPVHQSVDTVDTFPTSDDQEARQAEYDRRWADLSKDPAHKGAVNKGSEREATVALGLEQTGKMNHVERGDNERADFVDVDENGSQTEWDVKSVPSFGQTPGTEKDAYSDAKAQILIERKLKRGVNVVMDTGRMTGAGRASLESLIRSHPEWRGKVIVF